MHLDPANAAAKAHLLRQMGLLKRNEATAESDRKRNMAINQFPKVWENEDSSMASVISDTIQCTHSLIPSSELPASRHVDDPFHDDWPHW